MKNKEKSAITKGSKRSSLPFTVRIPNGMIRVKAIAMRSKVRSFVSEYTITSEAYMAKMSMYVKIYKRLFLKVIQQCLHLLRVSVKTRKDHPSF
jgi:hypothetical protein